METDLGAEPTRAQRVDGWAGAVTDHTIGIGMSGEFHNTPSEDKTTNAESFRRGTPDRIAMAASKRLKSQVGWYPTWVGVGHPLA
jgi:hypothetical protein